MRKKMLLLILSLAVLAGALAAPPVQAEDSYYCPQCTTDADGVRCCTDCWCTEVNGRFGPMVITNCTMMLTCEFPEGYW